MYENLIKMKDLSEQKALAFWNKKDKVTATFWKNASEGFEKKAKELPLMKCGDIYEPFRTIEQVEHLFGKDVIIDNGIHATVKGVGLNTMVGVPVLNIEFISKLDASSIVLDSVRALYRVTVDNHAFGCLIN